MASSGLELLWVSLPQLAKGAGQTLSISFLSIAISTVARAPISSRDRMSRPYWSVPSQCAALGPL